MESSIVVAVITTGGSIIATIGVIINTIISKKTNKKLETLDDLRKEFKKEIQDIKNNILEDKREAYKTELTNFLTDIENGEKKSQIQVKRAYEIYEEYIKLNGNSYIHKKWEELLNKGLL